jgi:diaminohydroxyphosphoribosylaminopyrimidine deaminase/5-amino-6-(5-phosphoribosylamino)uracil reductase
MARALALAEEQLGRTAPNPAVGCVIVKDGAIVGEGVTGDGGRPHAEEIALRMAGDEARGATAYVTLEPCDKRSSGAPSCTDLLIAAEIAEVHIAVRDPHPLANGGGIERLIDSGVRVELGEGESEALRQHAGFFRVVRERLPFVSESDDGAGFDARYSGRSDHREALKRAAREGLTRLWVEKGSDLARKLRALGLLQD